MRDVFGRIEDHRIPADERRKHLPRWNRHRKIERADQSGDSDRAAIAHRPLVSQLARHSVSKEPASFTRRVIRGVDSFLDVAARFGEGLAHLPRHRVGDLFLSRGHEVANEAQRQKIASDFATSLNPTYVVNNGLRVSAAEHNILDNTLGNRIVEFESGKATLTPTGQAILDQMGAAMQKLQGRKVEIIGHTDNQGLKASNQNLSQARAEAVKTYLTGKGLNGDMLTASGQGSDRPIASNDTPDGRARNRRIEFRIAQ